MGVNVGTAIAYLNLDMSGFKNSLAAAGADLKNFASSGSISNISSAMKGVGSEMTTKVTLPIVGAGAASAKMAMDFEDAMAKVSTISDNTQVPIGDLGDQIKNLSDQTGISSTEIANNVYDAISAGQSTGDAVNFVTNSTKLAKAGFAEAGQSLDLLTTILNSYGMKSSEVNRVSDILVNTQNVGKVTVAELAESMGKVIPTANSLGVNLEQVSSGYAIMTSKGIKAAESTTYMNSMLNELGKSGTSASKAVIAASGGKTFQELIASGKSLGDILAMIDVHAKKNNKSLSDMFGSSEAGKAAIILSNNAGKDFNDTLKKMGDVAGATDEAFKKVSATTSQQFKVALNSLKNAGISMGSVLLPHLAKLAEGISNLIKQFQDLPAPVKTTIVTVLGIAAAVGPILLILAKLITSVKTVVSVFASLSKIGSIVSALPALISSPVLIVIGIILGIAAVVFLVIKNWDKLKAYFGGFWNFVKNVFSAFWEWLKSFFGEWGPMILAILAPFIGIPLLIIKHWDKIKVALSNVFEGIKSGFQKVIDFFMNGFKGLKQFFTDTIGFFKNIGGFIIDGLLGGITEKWGAVKDKFSGMTSMIKSVFARGVDAHSPSRDFIKFGSYIGDGLVIGLDQQEEGISKKMNNITSKIKSIGNVSPELNKLNNMNVSGNYNVNSKGVGGGNNKSLNFTPNITMHVTIADTGAKGTEQLTSEVKDMTKTAMKNSMIDMFMKDVTSSY